MICAGSTPSVASLLLDELDEDLLVLLADEVDLGDARHAQQLGADVVGELLELAIAEAVAGERVDVACRCRRTRR